MNDEKWQTAEMTRKSEDPVCTDVELYINCTKLIDWNYFGTQFKHY